MDRFSAYLLLKKLVRDPETRHRARIAEHTMQQIATELGQPTETWAMMGLLLLLDHPYREHNPDATPGLVAREQAELDGLPAELGAALERCWGLTAEPTALEASLTLTGWLTQRVGGTADHELLAELERERDSASPDGERLDAALETLGLEAAQLVALARRGASLAEARP